MFASGALSLSFCGLACCERGRFFPTRVGLSIGFCFRKLHDLRSPRQKLNRRHWLVRCRHVVSERHVPTLRIRLFSFRLPPVASRKPFGFVPSPLIHGQFMQAFFAPRSVAFRRSLSAVHAQPSLHPHGPHVPATLGFFRSRCCAHSTVTSSEENPGPIGTGIMNQPTTPHAVADCRTSSFSRFTFLVFRLCLSSTSSHCLPLSIRIF